MESSLGIFPWYFSLAFFGRAGVPGPAVIVAVINANLRRLGKRVTDAKLSRCGMV
jgi:hypothetical protein